MENVQLLDNLNTKNSTFGTLYITTTHLIFVSPEVRVQTASYNIVQCNAVLRVGVNVCNQWVCFNKTREKPLPFL